jgi:RND family efflux transporter MFP subunit
MHESEAEKLEGAAKARVEKIRSLSLVREETAAPRTSRPSRLVVALGVALGVQTLFVGYFVATRGDAKAAAPAATHAAPRAPAAPSAPNAAIGGAGVRLQAQGFIIAMRQATVSTRVAGIVTEVPVDVGDHVDSGQVVGVLDADLARQDLQLAEKELLSLRSSVDRERARLEQADSEYQRELQLAQKNYSSAARVTERRTARNVAATALASAQADLAVGEVKVAQRRSLLANYTIRAPFAGIVIDRNSQVGELVAPMSAGGSFTRTGICTIVDMDSLELVVDVGEQQIAQVRVGQPVTFRLVANERAAVAGKVVRILPSADRGKGTLQVRIQILDQDSRVLPGMRANVDFM